MTNSKLQTQNYKFKLQITKLQNYKLQNYKLKLQITNSKS